MFTFSPLIVCLTLALGAASRTRTDTFHDKDMFDGVTIGGAAFSYPPPDPRLQTAETEPRNMELTFDMTIDHVRTGSCE